MKPNVDPKEKFGNSDFSEKEIENPSTSDLPKRILNDEDFDESDYLNDGAYAEDDID